MKIFVTYARRQRDIMIRLIDQLREIYPEDSIFYDTNISVGEDWLESILEEIRRSDLLLFLVSEESVQSQSCRLELQVASEQLIPILPLIIDQFQEPYWYSLPQDLMLQFRIRPVALTEGLDLEEIKADIDRLKTVTISPSTLTVQANALAAQKLFREALILLERRTSMSQKEKRDLRNLILHEQAKYELSKLLSIQVNQTHLTFNKDINYWLTQMANSISTDEANFVLWRQQADKVIRDRADYEEFERLKTSLSRIEDLKDNEKSYYHHQNAIEFIESSLKQNPENNFLADFLAELRSKFQYNGKELAIEIESINQEINIEKPLDLSELITRIDLLSQDYFHLRKNPEVAPYLEKLTSIRKQLVIEDHFKKQLLDLIEKFDKKKIDIEQVITALMRIENLNPSFSRRYTEYTMAQDLVARYQFFNHDFNEALIRLKQLSTIDGINDLERIVLQLQKSQFYRYLSEDDARSFHLFEVQLSILQDQRPYLEAIEQAIEDRNIVHALELYKTNLLNVNIPFSRILENLRSKLSQLLTEQLDHELNDIRKAYASGLSDDGDAKIQDMRVKYGKLV